MITKHDHVRRQTCADITITDVTRQALADNFEHITFTNERGFKSFDKYRPKIQTFSYLCENKKTPMNHLA